MSRTQAVWLGGVVLFFFAGTCNAQLRGILVEGTGGAAETSSARVETGGAITINNNTGLQQKDNGGTARTVLNLNSSNVLNLGTAVSGGPAVINVWRAGSSIPWMTFDNAGVDVHDLGLQAVNYLGDSSGNSAQLGMWTSRGFREGENEFAPKKLEENDCAGIILAQGYDEDEDGLPDGTNEIPGTSPVGSIAFCLDGETAPFDFPGRIEFYTTPDNEDQVQLRMTIKNTGDVGIGVAPPAARLHVFKAADEVGMFQGNTTRTLLDINNSSAGDGDPELRFMLTGSPIWSIGVDDSDGDKLKFSRAAMGTNDTVIIDTNGNVGISDSSPTSGDRHRNLI